MAAPRATSFRALNSLSQHSRRNLHITGVNSNPAATRSLAADRHAIYLPQSMGVLRTECRKRNLESGGTKDDLVERLTGHDMLQSRAFSIAMKRIDRKALGAGSPAETPPTRHFNTSRALKAVGDSSPMDFAYLPMSYSSYEKDTYAAQVPILPDNYSHTKIIEDDVAEPVMKPEIVTAAGDPSFTYGPSAMSEVTDNTAMEVDPYDLTQRVKKAANRALGGADLSEEQGAVKEVWNGLLDDIFGKKRGG